MSTPWRLSVGAFGAGALVLAVALSLPEGGAAYRNPELHLVLNAIEGMIGLLAAYLVFGRFRESRSLPDLLLVASLLGFSLTNLVMAGLAHELIGHERPVLVWGPVAVRTVAAAMLVGAAWAPARPVRREWTFRTLVTAAFAAMLVVFSLVSTFNGPLPHVLQSSEVLEGRAFTDADSAAAVSQGLLAVLFAAASLRLTRTAARLRDELLVWVGAGAALAAMARVNYAFFPSLYSDYVYTGDLLRLGWHLMLLVGASREIRAYWTRLERTIGDQARHAEELRQLALVDELTGLWNRRGFSAAAEPILKLARRGQSSPTLLFVDLNDMKAINDVYGHDSGDLALRETAAVLTSVLRDADVVARLGGDEFCALLHPVSDVARVVERIEESVRERESVRAHEWKLSLAIGSATFDPARHPTLEDVVDEADRAMYERKAEAKLGRRSRTAPGVS